MKLIGLVIVFICSFVFAVLGGVLLSYSFGLFSLEDLSVVLQQIFPIGNTGLIVGAAGLFLVISSISIAQIIFGGRQREKTIAFNNPSGEVTVSLAAIEDFIKRLASSVGEIRDLRSSVLAGKKGIEIKTRVSLWANVNIPETTENVQSLIRTKIQEMLGIEEAITVKVHVGKIVHKEKKKEKKKPKEQAQEEQIPFTGNIEYGKD
ncbi:alkaline shock response membrane anchor protein AmaP [Candidatus Omnitrophota bacterium]